MTTQGPDPYCTYPTTDEFSSIFSILPPTPIIPTSGPGASSTATPQPDSMSTFYGHHEANPFSTARTQATAANRHLFGEASSVESKESMMNKATILTTAAATAVVATARDMSESSNSSSDTKHNSTEQGSNIRRAKSPELAVQTLSVQDTTASKECDESTSKDVDYFNNTNQQQEASTESESPASSSTQGVNLRSGEQHHRNHSSKNIDDSSGPASSPSEPSSSVPSYSLHRSRSGSRSHLMLASTPDSPPVRTGIHIGQDSELLNNRDFSFSYEPTELLGHRTSHLHHSHSRDFHGFDEMEEDDQVMGGFRSASPKPDLHQEPEQGHQTEDEAHKSDEPEKQPQLQQPQIHELRHQSSQGQFNRGSSTNLSILGSSTSGSTTGGNGSPRQNGIISGIATSILRSSGRIRSSASSSLGHSPDGSEDGELDETSSFFEPTSSSTKRTEDVADHIRELGRGFDEGIPAFTEDEMDIPSIRRTSQERERAFMIGALENSGFGQESNSSEDLRKLDGGGSMSGRGSRTASVIGKKSSTESIRMADGSCRDI